MFISPSNRFTYFRNKIVPQIVPTFAPEINLYHFSLLLWFFGTPFMCQYFSHLHLGLIIIDCCRLQVCRDTQMWGKTLEWIYLTKKVIAVCGTEVIRTLISNEYKNESAGWEGGPHRSSFFFRILEEMSKSYCVFV